MSEFAKETTMSMVEERTLELNILSARDLKNFSHFGSDTDYVVAYIHPYDKRATGVDQNGGNNPTWNTKLTLICDEKLLQESGGYIMLEIYSYGSFCNKLVGTAKISLQEVGNQIREGSQSQRMLYEVRRPSGKVKGVINVSVKVGQKKGVDQTEPVTGYPVSHPAYPPQQYAQQYGGPYTPSQQQNQPQYRQSSKYSGGGTGGVGLGFLGMVVGGLLIGDMIGDCFI